MSDIGLIMNGLLGVLLIGALFVGWRLEGRLKALRASHQSFTEAVHDLDRAAARAEQGLADLRAATDEAADSLAGRIERAAQLSGRLETLLTASSAAEHRLANLPRAAQPQPEAAPAREQVLQRFAERYGAMGASPAGQAASAHALAQAAARNDLILEDEPEAEPKVALLRRPVNERLERLKALAQPRPLPSHPAVRIEDELFDGPDLRRAGGLR